MSVISGNAGSVTDNRDTADETAAGGSATKSRASIGRILREPLVQFLAVGVVVFAGYSLADRDAETAAEDDPQRIEITADDLRQLTVAWLAQGRPAPTPAELQALVEQKVTSEVLFREATALGLDRDDEIIKRRLAQKMDFLVADVAAMAPPSSAELEAWFEDNAARFALPPHASFRHLYFSFDKHGNATREAAAGGLAQVAGMPADAPEAASIADPFMFRNYYGDATPEQMAKEFGPGFADALFRLTPGSWQGPIESGYGWHLVFVDSLERGRIPAFEEVLPVVKERWQEERYREVRERALAEMRSRYEIVVPPLADIDLDDLAIPARAPSPSEP